MITYADSFQDLLSTIIGSNILHAKWLNTLSYLENCGARKIAACEHPTLVKEEMLKHAAEEFRHAHHLKRQMRKLSPEPRFPPSREEKHGQDPLESYSLPLLLGGTAALHYLNALDVKTSRFLRNRGLAKNAVRELAYLLVTYAIERRAEELYPIYHQCLRKAHSPIAVKSILLEEKEHLEEMRKGLSRLPSGFLFTKQICLFESQLCGLWICAIKKEIEQGQCTPIKISTSASSGF